MALAYK